MRIAFTRDDCAIKCDVNTDTSACATVIPFGWNTANQVTAEVMRLWLQEQLGDMMSEIRQANYRMGWEDKQKKRRKRVRAIRYCGLLRDEGGTR